MKTNEISKIWMKYYGFAKEYYDKNGDLLIPQYYEVKDEKENIYKLGSWISRQRYIINGTFPGDLSDEQIKLLNDIEMVWDVHLNNWMTYYDFAKKYYDEHGNLLIPRYYAVKDEKENIYNLGKWINTQRSARKGIGNCKLSDEQIKLLNEIGMVWDVYSNSWMKYYSFAKKYYDEHRDLLIPTHYEVKDEKGNIYNLGKWIETQRATIKGISTCKLSDEQIKLLNDIEMVWDARLNNWMKYYEFAKKYYDEHDNLIIPTHYEVKDEKGNIYKLGNWINTQRSARKGIGNCKLSDEQTKLLDDIEMVWNLREYKHFHNKITPANQLKVKKLLLEKLREVLSSQSKNPKFNSKDDIDNINKLIYDKII